MLKLDFSIESANGRAEYVNRYMDPCANYTKKELETISNYLLYGKDADGTSCVDRKEIEIKTRYNSYSKKEAESLDALIEKPTFDERIIQSGPTRYKVSKPSIDREKDFDVPGMGELWDVIDEIQHVIDVNKGKEEDETVKKLNSTELYQCQHQLIELRRQQFTLRDMVKPTICRAKTTVRPVYEMKEEGIPWDEEGNSLFSIAPLGLKQSNELRFENPRALEEKDYHWNEKAKYILDFRNEMHIYELFENYEILEMEKEDISSAAGAILETLDFYRERAKLSDEQREILRLKIERVPNQRISEIIQEKFHSSHSANYISTIYKQKICEKVAAAAILHYDYYMNRDVPTAWKKCSCCGEYKLKDTREYMRRARSSDGLAPICKDCEKKKRNEQR